jgi:Hemerythrin HHE cation binding domain
MRALQRRCAAICLGCGMRPSSRRLRGRASTVLAGWGAFRAQLDNHHSAEDDDLWPVLRGELSGPGDLASVDAMVEEHRHIPPALAGVDAALRGGGELTAPVELLSAVVLDHLAHEERGVLPLIEQHLTRAQWRAFLHPERSRRSPRERPGFLTWILDDTGEQDAAAVFTEMPPPARGPTAGCSAPLRRAASVADPQSRHETLNGPPVTRPGHRERPAAGMTSHLRQQAGKWPARPRTQRSCGRLAPPGHPGGRALPGVRVARLVSALPGSLGAYGDHDRAP